MKLSCTSPDTKSPRRLKVEDEWFAGKPVNVTFTRILREKQPDAVTKLLKHDEGVLCAGTAFGFF